MQKARKSYSFTIIMRKPPSLLIIIPVTLLLIAYIRARISYYRDPTSLFFDRRRAYDRIYSEIRQSQADAFIEASTSQTFLRSPRAERPLLCIGIPTFKSENGSSYIRETIGSLLAGLDQSERDAIYLMPFITNSDPTSHPVHNETWLYNAADQVLTYNQLDTLAHVSLGHMEGLEQDRYNREKGIFDYAYLLGACLQMNASYIAIFEDGTLALDGWFHRTRAALEEVQKQVKVLGLAPFFYLRLFYTEQSLGWNSEFWTYYLFYSIIVTSAALSAAYFYIRRTPSVQNRTNSIHATTIMFCAIGIGFFFACGRVSMLPTAYGIHQMPNYACCAQGLVYNPDWVPRLIDHFQSRRFGYVDTLCEELADAGEVGTRWALTPSVVQDVETQRPQVEGEEDEEDEQLDGKMFASQHKWNFAFELNNAKLLHLEHVKAIRKYVA